MSDVDVWVCYVERVYCVKKEKMSCGEGGWWSWEVTD